MNDTKVVESIKDICDTNKHNTRPHWDKNIKVSLRICNKFSDDVCLSREGVMMEQNLNCSEFRNKERRKSNYIKHRLIFMKWRMGKRSYDDWWGSPKCFNFFLTLQDIGCLNTNEKTQEKKKD